MELICNEENSNILNSINSKIEETLKRCLIFSENKEHIYLTEKNNFYKLHNQLNKGNEYELERGFALTYKNYPYQERELYCHLIIVNTNKINILSENELIAVLLHEIGHILNVFPPCNNYREYFMNNIQRATNFKKIISEKQANEKDEYYADYFAKKTGYRIHLKSALDKFVEQIDSTKQLAFDKRKAKLDEDIEMVGVIKNLKEW